MPKYYVNYIVENPKGHKTIKEVELEATSKKDFIQKVINQHSKSYKVYIAEECIEER